jgi:hypothetical protein
MNSIIYLVGLVVVVLAVPGLPRHPLIARRPGSA